MGHYRPLFLYFCLFNIVVSKQMFHINFADDWIRTADRWYWKRRLHQLSHNLCPKTIDFSVDFDVVLNGLYSAKLAKNLPRNLNLSDVTGWCPHHGLSSRLPQHRCRVRILR